MHLRAPISALTAGTLILAAACSDRTEPTAPSAPPGGVSLKPENQEPSDDPIALGRQIPGFGGFYLDDQGTPVVYLKNVAARGNAQRALAPFLQHQGIAASQLRVLPAQYDFAQLEEWLTVTSQEVLSIPGAVFVDANEASNRVTVGVERGSLARIRGAVARLGVPQSAVEFQEAEPIRMLATLESKVRPALGGLKINFPGFFCSLGFNAIRNGQRSFITASHCTNHQGGVEATPYFQPTEAASPIKIATEVSDPTYSQSKAGCPGGFRCRFSDASRASYTASTSSSLGKIAKTTGPNNNSVTINGSFTITAEGKASAGQTVGKVGLTSGWTTGKVAHTCATVKVLGTKLAQLCQTIVSARAREGDSGAPVFKGSSNVTLVGLLWGGDNTQFVYSTITNIERELGALTTF